MRYSDTDGFERDGFRKDAWRYRDYVVDAFNNDKPFNRFVQEQIAGDELFPGDREAYTATGFIGLGPRHVVGGNQDKEESRQEVLTEMSQGVGSVFLGLTIQCARCHDHKFDPIAQADYYKLQAFFAGTEIFESNLAPVDELLAHEAAVAAHKKRLAPIKKRLEEILSVAAESSARSLSQVIEDEGHSRVDHEILSGRFPASVESWLTSHEPDLLVKQCLPCDGEFGHASKGDVRLCRHVNVPLLLLNADVSPHLPVLVGIPPIHADDRGLSRAVRIIRQGDAID